ncbi:hypothetical protein LTR66_011822 [Elasticomyces elasticus]|nr:hypothetical protein LTR66_011822 [Elasticomyces elasticus]KAK4983428.1 hypothetical protein LTR50_007238 [Elasticomyces elasticus]
MGGFIEVTKIVLLPALAALALYSLIAQVIIPLIRRHRQRYSQYTPLHSTSFSDRANGLRNRIGNGLTAFVLPSFGRARNVTVPNGSSRERSMSGSDEELFGDEQGENMVSFEQDERRRRREEAERIRGHIEDRRRLSRDLEEGFMDESEDDGSTTG